MSLTSARAPGHARARAAVRRVLAWVVAGTAVGAIATDAYLHRRDDAYARGEIRLEVAAGGVSVHPDPDRSVRRSVDVELTMRQRASSPVVIEGVSVGSDDPELEYRAPGGPVRVDAGEAPAVVTVGLALECVDGGPPPPTLTFSVRGADGRLHSVRPARIPGLPEQWAGQVGWACRAPRLHAEDAAPTATVARRGMTLEVAVGVRDLSGVDGHVVARRVRLTTQGTTTLPTDTPVRIHPGRAASVHFPVVVDDCRAALSDPQAPQLELSGVRRVVPGARPSRGRTMRVPLSNLVTELVRAVHDACTGRLTRP